MWLRKSSKPKLDNDGSVSAMLGALLVAYGALKAPLLPPMVDRLRVWSDAIAIAVAIANYVIHLFDPQAERGLQGFRWLIRRPYKKRLVGYLLEAVARQRSDSHRSPCHVT